MADKVTKVTYAYVTVPDRPGRGAKLLGALKTAGVNLRAYSGFPAGGGKAQIDLVAEQTSALKRVAKREGWKLSGTKKAFLVTGKDRVGAVASVITRLADAGVNVTAADAVSAGGGSYGMILWVKPGSYSKAAKVLHAR